MKSRVEGGVPIGILGYHDGAPIAWCSIAPRDTYRELGGLDNSSVHENVWAAGAVTALPRLPQASRFIRNHRP